MTAQDRFTEKSISRRNCIKLMGGFALAAGTAMILPACNASGQAKEGSASSAEDKNAKLRVGVSGASNDVLDVAGMLGGVGMLVNSHVFDSVMVLNGDTYNYQLADKVTPNADATEWTIHVRDGVTFHDGKHITADDVLYSLKYIANAPVGMQGYQNVDWQNSSSDGDKTVVLKLTRPQSSLVEDAFGEISIVFPSGSSGKDFETDIGSGPFKLVSFSADTGTVMEAYEDYWDGAPSIKTLEFVPMADASSRTTALLGGQIDFAADISATDAATVEGKSGFEVLAPSVPANGYKFCLNASKAPFDDAEVRKALKMIVDRDSMVETILRGKGTVGNDILGKGLPGYDDSLKQRAYDYDAAAKVLHDKGVTKLDVLTSEMIPGIKDSVDVLAQQMKKAGVTLNVTEADPSTLFTDLSTIYNAQIFATYLINRPFVATALYTEAASPWNFSQWKDEEYNALLDKGRGTSDKDALTEIYDKAQQRYWDAGAEVVWGYAYALSGMVAGLTGVGSSHSSPLFVKAQFA